MTENRYEGALERMQREGIGGPEHPIERAERGRIDVEPQRELPPRDEAGRFVGADDQVLTGRAALEAEHGFTEMEELPYERAERQQREAAEAGLEPGLSEPTAPIVERKFTNVPDNATVTAERASHLLAESRRWDAAVGEQQKLAEFAASLEPQPTPTAAEQPPPEAQAVPQQPMPPDPQAELELALQNPIVRQTVEAQYQQIEQTKQQYAAAVAQAGQIAIAATLDAFPELKNLSQEQLPVALKMMESKDPARYQEARRHVDRVYDLAREQARVLHERQTIAQAQQIQQQQAAAVAYQRWAEEQDRQFMERVPEFSDPSTRAQMQQSVLEDLKSRGFSQEELLAHYNGGLMRDARSQQILVDAMKFRQAQAALKHSVARPVPPTQRPSSRPFGTRGNEEGGRVFDLQRQLDNATTTREALRAAAALRAARHRR